MNIVIAGGTGALGQHFIDKLKNHHEIIILSRSKNRKISKNIDLINYSDNIHNWAKSLKDSDVIINLVGEPIARKRWTSKQKKIILSSRLESVEKISEALKIINHKPKIIMNASAVGYYKDSYNSVNENSPVGNDFLSEVCYLWEKKANDCFNNQTQQLILLRIGIVLDSKSGMLSKMIVPFKLCFGTIIGNGKQYIPWIHINDVIGIIDYLIKSNIKGAVNLVSPKINTNQEFSEKLGQALKRNVFFKIPSFLIKILLGEMSTMLLKSSNIHSSILSSSKYKFEFENLDEALRDLLP